MNNKNIVLAVAAVLVIGAVGVGFFFMSGDNEEATYMTFLIQDEEGVYFWMKGEGEDGYTAFKNACKTYKIENETLLIDNYGQSIESIFGLEMEQTVPPSEGNEFGDWIYWNQYSFIDNEWLFNDLSIDKIKSSDVDAIALVYTDKSDTPIVNPSDAKIWNLSTKGTVFTIDSPSGISFKVNGEGTTVMEAFLDATSKYNIPFVHTGPENDPNGIDSIFGIEAREIAPPSEEFPFGVWAWWIQKVATEDGEGWEQASKGMNLLETSDIKEMLLIFDSEGM